MVALVKQLFANYIPPEALDNYLEDFEDGHFQVSLAGPTIFRPAMPVRDTPDETGFLNTIAEIRYNVIDIDFNDCTLTFFDYTKNPDEDPEPPVAVLKFNLSLMSFSPV